MTWSRRLTNELKKNPYPHEFVHDESNGTRILRFQVPELGVVEFDDLSRYPYRAPRVRVNGSPFSFFLSDFSKQEEHLYKKRYPMPCCLRCASFDCPNNWNVMITLQHIIHEILEIDQRKKDVRHILMCAEIQERFNIPAELRLECFLVDSGSNSTNGHLP